jgi:hypothetical protein
MTRKSPLIVLVCLALLAPALAQTDEKRAAENAAADFLRSLDRDELGEVYERFAAPSFKSFMDKPMFEQQSAFMRIQWGGPAMTRVIAGSMPFLQNSQGQSGTFYYVRYKATFPNGSIFQDVYLEKIDSAWKITSLQFNPAPN